MAADYFASTQHLYWERAPLGRDSALSGQPAAPGDLATKYPLPEPRLVNTYLQQQLTKLGKRLNTRQIVLATALVFVRRLYTTVDIRETNPYLVVATAFYLACKIEECPQHIKVVVAEARTLWSDLMPQDTSKLGECEFFLISKIHAHLILHHPYRSLGELQKTLGLNGDEMALAWYVINDHYVTDLPLRYPPHVIATAAVVLTLVVRPSAGPQHGAGQQQQQQQATVAGAVEGKMVVPGGGQRAQQQQQQHEATAKTGQSKRQRLGEWLVEGSAMDAGALADCVQQMVSLYALWEQQRESEKECKEKINAFVKALHMG